MPPSNRALWLQAKFDTKMVIGPAAYPTIGDDELIIRTTAFAINPADWIIQRFGVLVAAYPAVIGFDVAGVVQEVGAGLASTFNPGDRVFGAADLRKGDAYAAFQEFVVLREPYVALVPDGVQEAEAVVLPWGVNTAASCLFGEETLGLEVPSTEMGIAERGVLIVWGASSSVGVSGVQLATSAGYEVLAVASARNFKMLRAVGTTECFDYHDDDVEERIVDALRGKRVVGGYDAISTNDTIGKMCSILSKCDSDATKVIAGVNPGIEAFATGGVEVKANFEVIANAAFHNKIGATLWKDFLPAVLRAEKFQYKPDAEIVGHGLDRVQQAIDLLADRGVSARKLVVTM